MEFWQAVAFTEPDTTWPDPWVLAGAVMAVTTTLRFTTNIYIGPIREPLLVAKQVGTAAVLSGNRVVLGLGAGWMKEEFDLLGQDFATRGPRLNEMIEVCRKVWAGGMVEHHGEHYDLPRLQMSPAPTRPVPIWCGGHTKAAIRRAATLCDGWVGNAYAVDEVFERAAAMHRALEEAGRADVPFDVVIGAMAMPEPDLFKRMEDAGITGTLCVPWLSSFLPDDQGWKGEGRYQDSLEYKLRSIEKFGETVIAKL